MWIFMHLRVQILCVGNTIPGKLSRIDEQIVMKNV
jgi:hypothetical protein